MTTVSKVQVHANPGEAYNLIVTLDNENATLRALLDRAEKALDKFFSPAMLTNLAAADQLNSDLVGFGDNNKIDREDIELSPDMTWGDLRLARSTFEDIRKGKG